LTQNLQNQYYYWDHSFCPQIGDRQEFGVTATGFAGFLLKTLRPLEFTVLPIRWRLIGVGEPL